MDILIKILQLLLSLTILVLVHEFGHFFFAKLFKTRVEKFYLFFDPWFSLLKFTKKGTEYGIGWIPLGGYVKISGMIDESMDKEQLKKPPQEWEFRSKKTWQRFLIMIGGVSFNVLLAIAIFIFTLYVWGENFLPNANVTNGIAVDSIGKHLGLRNGDKILSVDKHTIKDFSKIPAYIILNDAKTIQVLRDNKTEEIVLPAGYITKLIKHNSPEFLTVRVPFEIADFAAKSPARDGGLKINDKIIGIDTIKTLFFDEFRAEIVKHKKQIVNIKAIRGADTIIAKIHV
ncbi:MAG: site-2 protease family protein, partial [Bacteroidales bacterium]|nr:site-2 protease family protein [Bacteroidales bacterium]